MATTPVSPGRINAVPLQALRARARGLWSWWTGELLGLMPQKWSALAAAHSDAPLVALHGSDLVRYEARLGSLTEVQRVSLATLAPEGQRMALLGLLGGDKNTVRLVLPMDMVIGKDVWLPAATAENLREVVGFELDRHTPFRADHAYYDFRIQRRDAERGLIQVGFVAAARRNLDALVEQIEALGARVVAAHVREDMQGSGRPRDLLTGKTLAEGGHLIWNRTNLVLAAVLLLLVLATAVIPLWNMRSAAIALLPKLEKARAEARAVDVIRTELDTLVTDNNHAAARKYATPSAVQVLEEVSKALSDNTWLQVLQLKPQAKLREVIITGETTASAKLIEVLEQGGMFRNASFRSTLTKGQSAAHERFEISAEVKPRTPPVPVPDAELAGAAAGPGATPAAPAGVAPAGAPAAAAGTPPAPAAVPAVSADPGVAKPAPTATVSVPPPKPGTAPAQPAAPAAGAAPAANIEIPEYFRQRPWMQYTPPPKETAPAAPEKKP